jgi:hypothetical protein
LQGFSPRQALITTVVVADNDFVGISGLLPNRSALDKWESLVTSLFTCRLRNRHFEK